MLTFRSKHLCALVQIYTAANMTGEYFKYLSFLSWYSIYIFNNVPKCFQLKKSIKPPEIPSKHVRNWVPKVLEQRRHGLELYLQVPWQFFKSVSCSHTVFLFLPNTFFTFYIYYIQFCLTQHKHINYSTNVEQFNKFELPKTSHAGHFSSAPPLHAHAAICFCFVSSVRL